MSRRQMEHAPHPLLKSYWVLHRGRELASPEDCCPGCGGALDFEHHDAWHGLKLWNDDRMEEARQLREAEFDRKLAATEKSRQNLERAQRQEAPAPWDLF